ncbi:MBL fold metallo-hydrolase [Phaeovulum vinaykumarii]|uniref:Hydroxyacylglutathione hydrolase n=1 Tax=Phaeovulum vinaykumarii TaxID=407234 RepID=A0A1N7MNG7_9RHOB|nr:MBL fold metallo-hydrolase [Phaeovulum vinaykumarii]SIS87694.1 hydroxyacylglutathione hydrolase [Phaeovulum vinaykumarii]SOC12997.1 hydroxyacylglutathione hydrolase [Phaeovulum vinaykumarii]
MSPPRPGAPRWLAPGLRVVLAPNPGPMTLHGTNTYILGEGAVAVIDPGPDDPHHLAAILAALAPGESVSHIFVTHAHLDHSPLAGPLARATGAQVHAFGPPEAGRSPRMAALGTRIGGGEGVDTGFRPDICLPCGARIEGPGWWLRALHTPGHFSNHLCFESAVGTFSGDHVMGWASTLISPPDGDLSAYFTALDRLEALTSPRLFPGHGDPVEAPTARIAELRAHRQTRTAQILAALADGPASAEDLARRIYTDTPAALMGAATRNVLAHLLDLEEKDQIRAAGDPAPETRFTRLENL